MKKENKIIYPSVSDFDFNISYAEVSRKDPESLTDSHVHPECEIYINLAGDVSFMVEQRIYPILSGNIVITRPYEYHHCIYHTDAPHKHFWILFKSEGNEELLGRFFNRNRGEGNLLALPKKEQNRLFEICHSLTEQNQSKALSLSQFFELISLIELADEVTPYTRGYDDILASALSYIDAHFREELSIRLIAERSHVSINTLERHFLNTLGMTPTTYIKKKRLAHAASLLWGGSSVLDASMASGFTDYAGFISLFKKSYGMTPLKYKKSLGSVDQK